MSNVIECDTTRLWLRDHCPPPEDFTSTASLPNHSMFTRNTVDDLILAAIEGSVPDLRTCLSSGFNIDYRTPTAGNTALMFAARAGHTQAVRFLLQRNARADMTNESGLTALDFAKQKRHHDTADLLHAATEAKPLAQLLHECNRETQESKNEVFFVSMPCSLP